MDRETNQFGIVDIPNSALTLKDVPAPRSKFAGVISRFALTFDGYTHFGDRCGKIANEALRQYKETGNLPESLDDLRTCLFFEQRRWRHFGEEPDAAAMVYIRALLGAIRAAVGAVKRRR